MTEQPPFKSRVIIIGAGIAGLALAAILEQASIPYDIYERASSVKPLGSAISFGPGLFPVFEQLGVLDQITARSKIVGKNHIWNEKLELQGTLDYELDTSKYGYESIIPVIISRPALYDILLNLIPKHKIHYSKRIVSYTETVDGVTVQMSDSSTYQGHILVGADGAYSGVRQSMYEKLDAEGKLSASDKAPLGFSSICLVGQTTPLDPTSVPAFADRFCRFDSTLGSGPYFWVTFTTAENTICWMVVKLLDQVAHKDQDTSLNSEWGPEAAETMANDVRDSPIACGDYKTMGELIDLTPKDLMSKVMLEEKVFEAWYRGRTVLLGDACHKMTPNAGLGATNGIFDAIALGNYLSTLHNDNIKDISSTFQQYQDERAPLAKKAVEKSAAFAYVVGRSWYNQLIRKAATSMPKWLWDMTWSEQIRYRPQISFLPPANDRGLVEPLYQRSLEVTRPKHLAAATSTVVVSV
ncbi:hypothetical protein EDD11_008917 [Mortierella claussenii]|nr:hypothetical protein EDD11_008917 [Mortierella claussenii]